MNLYFNSWDETCKSSFGAISINSDITFQFYVENAEDANVSLIISKDGKPATSLLLSKLSANHYTINYHVSDDYGLYFYHFQVQAGNQSFYYGCNQKGYGGIGQVYEHLHDVQQYQITVFQKEDPVIPWYQNGIGYHIFVDRFYNGDESIIKHPKKNSFIYANKDDLPYYIKDSKGDIARWDFYGGNLKGIEKKIPYLKELGVSFLYLSPVFESRSNHKYDTADYLKIDSMFGGEEDFNSLIEALHQNGIRLILDGVFNHVGYDSRYFNALNTYDDIGAFQSQDSPYYHWFHFKNFPHDYDSWWGIMDLPSIAKHSEGFQEFITNKESGVLVHWMKRKVDGWRLDVVDELSDAFVHAIRNTVNIFDDRLLIGEVWEDASNKISYDQRTSYFDGSHLHGVMNYPLRDAILSCLNKSMATKDYMNEILTLWEHYPRNNALASLNNIGTHDTKRLANELNEDEAKINQAFAMMFSLPGVPCIYYGDEVGLIGGKDPDNRRFFPWDKQNETRKEFVKTWTNLRASSTALQQGDFNIMVLDDIIIILRYDDTSYFFTFINISNNHQSLSFDAMQFVRPIDTKLKDILKAKLPLELSAQEIKYDYSSIK